MNREDLLTSQKASYVDTCKLILTPVGGRESWMLVVAMCTRLVGRKKVVMGIGIWICMWNLD